MKVQFILKNITGRRLAEVFTSAITMEGVGWEANFNSSAKLFVPEGDEIFEEWFTGERRTAYRVAAGDANINSPGMYPANYNSFFHEDLVQGPSWITAMSGFRYTCLNPEADEPALIEYEGAWRGFRRQELLPREIRGETAHARITGGGVFDALPTGVALEADNASLLIEAYGLLQGRSWVSGYCDPAASAAVNVAAALATAVSARQVDAALLAAFGRGRHGDREAWASAWVEDDHPGIKTWMQVAGRQVMFQ